ncbi:MAG: UbiA family prenyltransferase [Actinomycetota bacterium]|nr:UbiA family prenyltransferase [Actinomycetota bacterium]
MCLRRDRHGADGSARPSDRQCGVDSLRPHLYVTNATALNDLFDQAIERINLRGARDRLLVSGEVSRRQMWGIAGASGLGAPVLGVLISPVAGMVLGAGVLLSAAYSVPPVRLCARGAVASLLLPLCYVATPFVVGALSTGREMTWRGALLLAGGYAALAGRLLLKDFRDVQGDVLYGKRTFLIRHGRTATCAWSAAFWSVGAALIAAAVPAAFVVVPVTLSLGGVYWGLQQLGRAPDARTGQEISTAIGRMGSAIALTVLAALQFEAAGAPPVTRWAGAALIAAYFVGGLLCTLTVTSRRVEVSPGPAAA